MTRQEELLNTAILTRLSYFNLNVMVELYRQLGSATAIIEQRDTLRTMFPTLPSKITEALNDVETIRPRAEEELEYDEKHGVSVLCLNDDDYPRRLKECPDAPLMLFYKGTANLNAQRIINIVGTRHATPYGEDLIRRFVADLRHLCPELVIVSGLAYGIDICAHRNALLNHIDTIGVLAHGLDDLYPSHHRDVANEMVHHGGLLTEFMTRSNADKLNFVRRNRITAGISDACILVESAAKGGGLITTRISKEYNRDVFAFPGPVGAPYSEGCNRLIRDNGAALITSAEDFVKAMGWDDDNRIAAARQAGIARTLFPDLTPDEQKIVTLLRKTNDLQLNIISVKTAIPVGTVSSLLFGLEMKGIVKPYAGGTYHVM
ncbi:MAG: DNA-protecting protein DprA [Prevotella sp.]|nr:DNA-protecting protein DprA [Prevotella sp.]